MHHPKTQASDFAVYLDDDALVPPAAFDLVLDNPSCTYTLPGPPNLAVSTVDHALGLLASTLIRDGGTLQIGTVGSGLFATTADDCNHDRKDNYMAPIDFSSIVICKSHA